MDDRDSSWFQTQMDSNFCAPNAELKNGDQITTFISGGPDA